MRSENLEVIIDLQSDYPKPIQEALRPLLEHLNISSSKDGAAQKWCNLYSIHEMNVKVVQPDSNIQLVGDLEKGQRAIQVGTATASEGGLLHLSGVNLITSNILYDDMDLQYAVIGALGRGMGPTTQEGVWAGLVLYDGTIDPGADTKPIEDPDALQKELSGALDLLRQTMLGAIPSLERAQKALKILQSYGTRFFHITSL